MSMSMPVVGFPTSNNDVLTGRLLALLMRRRVTKARLADAIGVSASGVTRRLQGTIEWNLSEVRIASELLTTTVGYLLGETDDDRRPEHLRADATVTLLAPVKAELGVIDQRGDGANLRPRD